MEPGIAVSVGLTAPSVYILIFRFDSGDKRKWVMCVYNYDAFIYVKIIVKVGGNDRVGMEQLPPWRLLIDCSTFLLRGNEPFD